MNLKIYLIRLKRNKFQLIFLIEINANYETFYNLLRCDNSWSEQYHFYIGDVNFIMH